MVLSGRLAAVNFNELTLFWVVGLPFRLEEVAPYAPKVNGAALYKGSGACGFAHEGPWWQMFCWPQSVEPFLCGFHPPGVVSEADATDAAASLVVLMVVCLQICKIGSAVGIAVEINLYNSLLCPLRRCSLVCKGPYSHCPTSLRAGSDCAISQVGVPMVALRSEALKPFRRKKFKHFETLETREAESL